MGILNVRREFIETANVSHRQWMPARTGIATLRQNQNVGGTMDRRDLAELLERVANGAVAPEDAAEAIHVDAVSDLGFAQIDNTRGLRQGVSEIIYGAGKTASQISAIALAMLASGQKRILVTRLDAEKYAALPDALGIDYRPIARLGIIGDMPEPDGNGTIVVACGGTSDLPVAEEAALTAEFLGNTVTRLYDVGVAGIHRLLAHAEEIAGAQVIVAAAGMEGALPSVIGGLTAAPVIAVPTSIGYGANFGGVSALLAMLNSCASGVSVVNIDNGFGAGYQASAINHLKA